MKKLSFVLLIGSLFVNCSKKCDYDACAVVAPSSEIAAVQSYLSSNNITATQHCSGVFYVVDNPGSGKQPNGCSTVSVNYEGKLTNGSVFDQTNGNPAVFDMSGLIRGFTNGTLQIKKGGKVRVYVPPSLGYGSQARPGIPANSILIFTIDLIDVQ